MITMTEQIWAKIFGREPKEPTYDKGKIRLERDMLKARRFCSQFVNRGLK